MILVNDRFRFVTGGRSEWKIEPRFAGLIKKSQPFPSYILRNLSRAYYRTPYIPADWYTSVITDISDG